VVIGVSLLINYQVSVSFFPAVGIAAGGAVGFVILSALTAEAVERLDNPDIPRAFRGLPATLVYLGLLALALMGFKANLNLI
jgi:Na+-translocating ferredoxin:NAD+ oxidoreductase RnfA subunit